MSGGINLLFLVTSVIPPYLICVLLVVSIFHACSILLNLYHSVKESPLLLQRRDRDLRSLSKLTSHFKPRCSNLKAHSLNRSTTLPPFGMPQGCHWVLANFSCMSTWQNWLWSPAVKGHRWWDSTWAAAVLGSCSSGSVTPYVFHRPFATSGCSIASCFREKKLFKQPDLHCPGSKQL